MSQMLLHDVSPPPPLHNTNNSLMTFLFLFLAGKCSQIRLQATFIFLVVMTRRHYIRPASTPPLGNRAAATTGIMERLQPRVATLSPSTSSGVMCPPWVRRSSSVTGLLSTWLLRDLSLFRTPPPVLRSRWGAAALCPPPETLSATDASLRALAPLIVGYSLPPSDGLRPAINA